MIVHRKKRFAGLLLCLVLSFWGYGQALALGPAPGMFLVANEKFADPRFRDSVILLIQHDATGSAGLIINRSSRLPLRAVVPKGSTLDRGTGVLWYGGPVDPQTLLALVRVHRTPPDPADEVLENLYVTGVGVLSQWSDFDREVVDFRAFSGYTGWQPGQLNAEFQRGDWAVLPADEESVFTGRDETLWNRLRSRIAENK